MALTTAGLITLCQNRYNDPNGNIVAATGSAGASWETYLNQAYRWVQANSGPAQWPFTLQTTHLTYPANSGGIDTGGTQSLPAGCGTLNVVFNNTDGYILEPMPTRLEEFIQFPNAGVDYGSPNYYRVKGTLLEIIPHPGYVVDIYLEFEGDLPDLVSGSVDPTPAFPVRHAQVLVEYAMYLAYTDDDDNDTAQIHLQRAQEQLRAMQADLFSNRNTRNYEIVDEWF